MTKLFVRQDIGTGDPLVLLHGMFGDGSQWATISKILSKQYRVIVVDILGHGRSPRPKNAKYTATEHVKALRNTLESLNATENLTVVGYSMGGAVALSYSSTYPDDTQQLYLISTPFYLKPEEMIPNRYAGSMLFTKVSTGFFGLVEHLMHPGRVGDGVVRFGNSSKKFHAMIGANDNVLDTDIIRKNINQLVHEFDFVGYLKNLKVPLTFYAGKKDVFVVQPQLNALRQYQPNMDIQRLDVIKIDHMLVQNLPHEIAALIGKNAISVLHSTVEKGKGTPLLLIHGIEGSSNYWRSLLKPLGEYNQPITIDLLGFGKSPKPLNIPYSLDDQVARLEATVNELGIKKFQIMAHSLGSLVALAYAAKYPKKVESLTLLAPVLVPDQMVSTNQLLKRINFFDKLTDSSYLYSRAASALGYRHISKYLPTIRSIKNAVQQLKMVEYIKTIKNIPVTVLYGERDNLIDKGYLHQIIGKFKKSTIIEVPKQGHNFALFQPEQTLAYIYPGRKYKNKPAKAHVIPPTFAKQLVKLATPLLLFKSIVYIATGLLLFTQYAATVVTIGLALYIALFGYRYIRGSFSLKNERLSYIGYSLLGVALIAFGYFFLTHPDDALKVSTLIICGLVVLTGIARLIVGIYWTERKKIKRWLLLSGSLMTIIGALAVTGGLISIHLIVYTIAAVLIVRGAQFGIYASIAFVFAYVRGFGR